METKKEKGSCLGYFSWMLSRPGEESRMRSLRGLGWILGDREHPSRDGPAEPEPCKKKEGLTPGKKDRTQRKK